MRTLLLLCWLVSAAWGQAALQPCTPDPSASRWVRVDRMPAIKNLKQVQQQLGYPTTLPDTVGEGRVVLRVQVDDLGRPLCYQVQQSPHPAFVPLAVAAACRCRYEPATCEGKPIPFIHTLALDFRAPR